MSDPRVPIQESGTVDPERMWSVAMGDYRIVVYADDYEHATIELEMWCQENGVERSGADFLHGRLHDV